MKRLFMLVCLFWSCGVAWPQIVTPIPTLEVPGPLLTQTAWGAFQQTLNTVEAVFHSTQWILTLTGYEDTGLGGSYHTDLDDLEGIISETQGVLWDAQSLMNDTTRLLGLDGAPQSTMALQDRLWDIRKIQYERKTKALQIQTLPKRVTNLVARIRNLGARILDILGEKQGSQQVQAMLQQVQYLEGQSQVIQAAYNNAMLTDSMEHQLIGQSLWHINEAVYSTMPRPPGPWGFLGPRR